MKIKFSKSPVMMLAKLALRDCCALLLCSLFIPIIRADREVGLS